MSSIQHIELNNGRRANVIFLRERSTSFELNRSPYIELRMLETEDYVW